MTARRPLTVAELIELLEQFPPSSEVRPDLTPDAINHAMAAVNESGPPDCWDVPLEQLDLSAALYAESSRDGLTVFLPIELAE